MFLDDTHDEQIEATEDFDESSGESSLYEQLSLFEETDEAETESLNDFKEDVDSFDEEDSSSYEEQLSLFDEQDESETDEENSAHDIRFTPSENSSLGSWSGARGDSEFIPEDEEAQRILNICDAKGIDYCNGIINLSPVSVATVYLTDEEMEQLSDEKQKELACYSISDAEEDETDVNEELIQKIGQEEIEDPVEDFYSYVSEGKTPPDYVWHHGERSEDGDWAYQLVPRSIHALLHAGGRSHSGTSRK